MIKDRETKRIVLKKELKSLEKKIKLEEELRQDYKMYFGIESTIYQTQNELVNEINHIINLIKYILGE